MFPRGLLSSMAESWRLCPRQLPPQGPQYPYLHPLV